VSAPVFIFGYPVDGHGCDPRSLERLVLRGLREGVRLVADDATGAFVVRRPGSPGRYVVSVDRCTCPAGRHGQPCKHRSLLLLVRAILDGRPRGP